MRHPSTVTCDFCDKPIDTDQPWTAIDAAVPADVAADVRALWEQQASVHPLMASLSIPPSAFIRTPTHRAIDICRPCEDAKLPDLRPLVALLTMRMLEEQRAKAQRPDAKPQFKED